MLNHLLTYFPCRVQNIILFNQCLFHVPSNMELKARCIRFLYSHLIWHCPNLAFLTPRPLYHICSDHVHGSDHVQQYNKCIVAHERKWFGTLRLYMRVWNEGENWIGEEGGEVKRYPSYYICSPDQCYRTSINFHRERLLGFCYMCAHVLCCSALSSNVSWNDIFSFILSNVVT